MARKRWASSIHNLELYRATKLERERRRQSHQSQNAEAARKDLQARRLGRFSNILNALGCEVVTVDVGAASEFKLTARELDARLARGGAAGAAPLRGLVLSSPSNPTGAMLAPESHEGRGVERAPPTPRKAIRLSPTCSARMRRPTSADLSP